MILNCSNLPASVQKNSLGHGDQSKNWQKHYTDPTNTTVLKKVSKTISNVLNHDQQDKENVPNKGNNEHALQLHANVPLSVPTKAETECLPSRSGIVLSKIGATSTDQMVFEMPLGSVFSIILPGGVKMNFTV
jgi:hypothetical protein